MVSNASDDLPDPLRPVNTTRRSRGIERVTFFRLCSRAPRMVIRSVGTGRVSPGSLDYETGRRRGDKSLAALDSTLDDARAPAVMEDCAFRPDLLTRLDGADEVHLQIEGRVASALWHNGRHRPRHGAVGERADEAAVHHSLAVEQLLSAGDLHHGQPAPRLGHVHAQE